MELDKKILVTQEEGFKKSLLSVDKDISLFKLLLTPTELFILKFFFKEARPINLGEIYFVSTGLIFWSVTEKEDGVLKIKNNKESSLYIKSLNGDGYGLNLLTKEQKQKMLNSFSKQKLSQTEINKKMYESLVENKIKTPSYDKIKKVIESFESRGVLLKLKRERIATYTLNPELYSRFKDKIEEILNL